jgi:heptosyltransferase-1
VHAAPVVADLHRRFPDCRVDWVVDERFAPLVRLVAGPERVIALPLKRAQRAGLRAGLASLAAACRELRERPYDAVVDLQGLWKSALVARVARVAPGGLRIGFAAAHCGEPAAARLYDLRIDIVARPPEAPERRARAGRRRVRDRSARGARLRAGRAADERRRRRPPCRRGPAGARHGRCAQALARRGLDRGGARTGGGGRPALAALGRRRRARAQRARRGRRRARPLRGPDRAPTDRALAAPRGARPVGGGVDTGFTHIAAAAGAPTVGVFVGTPGWLLRPAAGGRAVALGAPDAPPAADAVLVAALGLLEPDPSAAAATAGATAMR